MTETATPTDRVNDTEDAEFSAWVKTLPAATWAKKDLSACRLGWDAARAASLNASSGEAVAWLHVRDDGRKTFWEAPTPDGLSIPLYAAPPVSNPVAALADDDPAEEGRQLGNERSDTFAPGEMRVTEPALDAAEDAFARGPDLGGINKPSDALKRRSTLRRAINAALAVMTGVKP